MSSSPRSCSPPPSQPRCTLTRTSSTSSNLSSASASSSSWPPRRTRSPSAPPSLFNLPHHLMLSPRKSFLSAGRKRKTSREPVSGAEDSADEFQVREGEDERRVSMDDTDEERSVRRRSLSMGAEDEFESEDISMDEREEVLAEEEGPPVPANSPSFLEIPLPPSPKLTAPPPLVLQDEVVSTLPLPSLLQQKQRSLSEPIPHSASLVPELQNGTFPLGQPLLRVAFCSEEGEDDVPPCFYPGQTIPTTLMFELPRYTSLPHALRPVLTMSLIGTLRFTDEDPETGFEVTRERSLINVGVSLAEGLRLWGKDAGLAFEKLSERKRRGRQNPKLGLPGGKYTLPLTVQVPTHPKLPPTFALPSRAFEIIYSLEVHLSIDNPNQELLVNVERERTVLIRAEREFTLLPVTLPSTKPDLPGLEGLVEIAASRTEVSVTSSTVAGATGWIDRLNMALGPLRENANSTHRFSMLGGALTAVAAAVAVPSPTLSTSWTIVPSLPTSAYSPSSNIPLDLTLVASSPSSTSDKTGRPLTGELLIRATLLRREHVYHSETMPSPADEERGLVKEEEILSSSGRFDLASLNIGPDGQIQLPRLNLPVGYGPRARLWTKGFTTSLTISPDASSTSESSPSSPIHTHCSSRFYLSLHLAFCPVSTSHTPASNVFSNPSSSRSPMEIPLNLKPRLLLIPITIGSVGEPQGARHRRGWRELYLERENGSGEERGRMISGVAVDDEGSWLVAPPSYQDALEAEEYIL